MKTMFTAKPKAAVQLVIVLAAAAALKQFYSTASANDLSWILWPTARLTELITGTQFTFESYSGYMSADRSFLIASACAGVNFLIAAFLMFTLRKLWDRRDTGVRWRYFPFAVILGYTVTVVANTIRISSALWLNASRARVGGLDHDEIHRLDGIFIYFGCLLLLFVVSEKATADKPVARIRAYIFPLAIYYAVTLAVPIANGALRQGFEFWQHAAFVFVTPLMLIAAMVTPTKLFSRYAKRKDVAARGSFLPADAAADEICTRANIRNAAAFSHRTIGLKCGPVITDR